MAPIERHGQRAPRGRRRYLFLARVMIEPAAVHTHAPAEHQRRDSGPVVQIGVIPVIDARPNDDRTLSLCLFRRCGEFPGELNNRLSPDPTELFLPGWCIGHTLVVVT